MEENTAESLAQPGRFQILLKPKWTQFIIPDNLITANYTELHPTTTNYT
jgi:hypothetical protein